MDRQSLIGLNHYVNKEGILVIEAQTPQKANESIAEILQKYADSKTALFLSGGTTPKKLYELIAEKKSLRAGAVGMIDERYKPNSKFKIQNSKLGTNENMIRESGLLEYLDLSNIRFYPILQENLGIEDTSRQYDEALRFIFKYFPKSVGILGIGSDSHTAGIPSRIHNSEFIIQNSNVVHRILEDRSSLVSFYELEGYGKRITMNFNALSMLDLIIVLVLSQEKREALKLMFDTSASSVQAGIEEVPSRFYLKPEIAEKVILITDQIV